MAYDEGLADRIRGLIGPDPQLTEKPMFGGLSFLIDGRMTVSASGKGGIMVRVDPGQADSLLATTSATTVVMRGREMPGWLRIGAEALMADEELDRWVTMSIDYVRSLQPGR